MSMEISHKFVSFFQAQGDNLQHFIVPSNGQKWS